MLILDPTDWEPEEQIKQKDQKIHEQIDGWVRYWLQSWRETQDS